LQKVLQFELDDAHELSSGSQQLEPLFGPSFVHLQAPFWQRYSFSQLDELDVLSLPPPLPPPPVPPPDDPSDEQAGRPRARPRAAIANSCFMT
jgi:hypothetical protein